MKTPAPRKPVAITSRFLLRVGRRYVFGPGKADLLEHLARTGSIAEAARAMGMSYMRAWKHVKSMETSFAEPLVHRVRGGPGRGGAELTPTGRRVLAAYRALESGTAAAVRAAEKRFAAALAAPRRR